MTKFQEKAQAQVKQMVGQMIGDERLVLEGQEQQQNADHEHAVTNDPSKQEQQRQKDETSEPPKKSREPGRRKGPVLE